VRCRHPHRGGACFPRSGCAAADRVVGPPSPGITATSRGGTRVDVLSSRRHRVDGLGSQSPGRRSAHVARSPTSDTERGVAVMLNISDLRVTIGPHTIVDIENLSVASGTRLGIVGESGSGKTMTAMSIVGLLPDDATVSGSIRFQDRELVGLSDRRMAEIRGRDIGVVFQDPAKALNPMMRIGRQVAEAIRLHMDLPAAKVRDRVVELLTQVHLPDAAGLLRRYTHQLSGGQQHRVLIAMAIACGPKLLIADEPTTALD